MSTGCLVGPDYQAPEVNAPPAWKQMEDPALVTGQAELTTWWTVFHDDTLTSLIEQAARENLDLKTAVARVREARARLGVARGYLYPSLDAAGSVEENRNSENYGSPAGARFTAYQAGLDASWEIDLFGRVRRSVEAAQDDLQTSVEDRRDAQVSLFAEVANTYLSLRTAQARLASAFGNIKSQMGALQLTRDRFKAGLATDLDVAQAERILASTEAEVPPLRITVTQSINALAVLLGTVPSRIFDQLVIPQDIPAPPTRVMVGVPTDLLRQRPDIRSAERQLAAQTARIGIATADLYPTFSLLGNFGFSTTNSANWFDWSSRAYGIGPSFSWNIFSAGRIRAQIKVQDALTEQALYYYEKTILTAISEVESALAGFTGQKEREKALGVSVEAAKRSVELSMQLYRDGLTDFQTVLDSQRDLFNFEDQLAQARGAASSNLVSLYKALGGGWNPALNEAVPFEPAPAPAPTGQAAQETPLFRAVPAAAQN
ncbi:MAG: efflux transporter outer membrane subunit [Deltaproteobacteria bacterium]|nr:efflux transporter outer membrane subunit [Deltaproteobacteria bacterium]